jgi:hypothetical protein
MAPTRRSLARLLAAPGLFALFLPGLPIAAQDREIEIVNMNERDWSLETSAALPWAEAEEYCETLESGSFSDWRLPTLEELEQLHAANTRLASRLSGSPFTFEDCCAWSSNNLATLPAERKGQLPAQSGAPEDYYWGLLFDGGVSYYSNGRFPDGFALCTRGD